MTHPSPPVIDRQDDPVCGHCGCWRSVHEDCDGTLYCPPHGATFEPTPTPSVVTDDEVERIYDALPKHGLEPEPYYSLTAIRTILAASDRDVLVAENERLREALSELVDAYEMWTKQGAALEPLRQARAALIPLGGGL